MLLVYWVELMLVRFVRPTENQLTNTSAFTEQRRSELMNWDTSEDLHVLLIRIIYYQH